MNQSFALSLRSTRIAVLLAVLGGFMVVGCGSSEESDGAATPASTAPVPGPAALESSGDSAAVWNAGVVGLATLEVTSLDPERDASLGQRRFAPPAGIERVEVSADFVVWQDRPGPTATGHNIRIFDMRDLDVPEAQPLVWAPWGAEPAEVATFALSGSWLSWIEEPDGDGLSRLGLADLSRPLISPIDLGAIETERFELVMTEAVLVWRDRNEVVSLAVPFDTAGVEVIGDLDTRSLASRLPLLATGSLVAWLHDGEVRIFDAMESGDSNVNPRVIAADGMRELSEQYVLFSRSSELGSLSYYSLDVRASEAEPVHVTGYSATRNYLANPPRLAGDLVTWASCRNHVETAFLSRKYRCSRTDPQMEVTIMDISTSDADRSRTTVASGLRYVSHLVGGRLGVAFRSDPGDDETVWFVNPSAEFSPGINPLPVLVGPHGADRLRVEDAGLVYFMPGHSPKRRIEIVEAAQLLMASDPSM